MNKALERGKDTHNTEDYAAHNDMYIYHRGKFPKNKKPHNLARSAHLQVVER
jgi:hypothetical protein